MQGVNAQTTHCDPRGHWLGCYYLDNVSRSHVNTSCTPGPTLEIPLGKDLVKASIPGGMISDQTCTHGNVSSVIRQTFLYLYPFILKESNLHLGRHEGPSEKAKLHQKQT